MFPTADQLAALRNPGPVTKAWLETVRTFADYEKVNNGKPAYGDWGQHDLTLFLAGDESRASRAADKIIAAWSDIETKSRNETREYAIQLALAYEWLKPKLTGLAKAKFQLILSNFAMLILDLWDGHPWGTRIGDSDEDVGHYFGLRLIARALNNPSMLTTKPGPQGSTLSDLRKEIARICNWARGGEYVESSDYNDGSLKLLALGAHALGIEEFPDVAEVLAEVVEQFWWDYTPAWPDAPPQVVEWGDDQTPRSYPLSARVALFSFLCGLGYDKDGKARSLLSLITKDQPATAYWFDLYRALWVFNPDSPAPTEPPQVYGFRDTPVGLSIHRGPDHLLAVFCPEPLGVDHQQTAPNIQLWHRGEWVLDSVRGYMVGASGNNAALLHGFGSMEKFGRVHVEGDADGCRIVWGTSGQYPVWRGDHVRPPEFVLGYTRDIAFDAKTITLSVADSFNGEPDVPTPEGYYDADRAVIENAPAAWQVLWHCPVEPLDGPRGFEWTTPGGQRVVVAAIGDDMRMVLPTRGNTPGYILDSELNGYTCRLLSNKPNPYITTTFILADAPVPPPVPPTPIPPVPPVPPVPPPPPVMEWVEVARNVHEIGTVQIESIFRERKSPAGKG